MGLLHWTGRNSEKTCCFWGRLKKDNMFYFTICSPLLLAAENGQLESMKFLVNELGHDIKMVGPTGRNNF
jgi:hypothetical protein